MHCVWYSTASSQISENIMQDLGYYIFFFIVLNAFLPLANVAV